jgi:hypothetical protein
VHERSSSGDDTFLFSCSTIVSIPKLHGIGFDYQLDDLFGWNTNCGNEAFHSNSIEMKIKVHLWDSPEYLPSQAIDFHALFSYDKPSKKLLY